MGPRGVGGCCGTPRPKPPNWCRVVDRSPACPPQTKQMKHMPHPPQLSQTLTSPPCQTHTVTCCSCRSLTALSNPPQPSTALANPHLSCTTLTNSHQPSLSLTSVSGALEPTTPALWLAVPCPTWTQTRYQATIPPTHSCADQRMRNVLDYGLAVVWSAPSRDVLKERGAGGGGGGGLELKSVCTKNGPSFGIFHFFPTIESAPCVLSWFCHLLFGWCKRVHEMCSGLLWGRYRVTSLQLHMS